jgi:hypothetical protein
MKITIFAKHKTDEKFAIICSREQIPLIQNKLNEQFGESWLYVEEINPFVEGFKFNDGLIYLGFHGRKERYLNKIINFLKRDNIWTQKP